jgi:hypothetical protein
MTNGWRIALYDPDHPRPGPRTLAEWGERIGLDEDEMRAYVRHGLGRLPHRCGRCGTTCPSAGAYVLHRCRGRV